MIKVVGERKTPNLNAYENHELAPFVKQYVQMTQDVMNECQVDMLRRVGDALCDRSALDSIKEFFVQESVDTEGKSPEEIQAHMEAMGELFENTRQQVLIESGMTGNLAGYSPVIGLTFPLHKNILMTNIFDSGVIPKVVAKSPTGTITMERRILVTPQGEEIDMFKQQDRIKQVMDSTVPVKEVELAVPEMGTTDILTAIGAGALDHLSKDTYVSAIKIGITTTAGDSDKWVDVNYQFTPSYNDYELSLIQRINIDSTIVPEHTGAAITDVLTATMHKDRFTITSTGKVKAIKVKTRRDTSNGLTATCSVKWDTKVTYYDIPDAIPLNVTISPEEIQDVAALYNNTNQLTKIMAMLKDVMGNHKDDTIRQKLEESFALIPDTDKVEANFDFAPEDHYALDHVKWRHDTFFDALDSHVTTMLEVLNDPNMEVQIFGKPDLIRKITPTNYDFTSSDSVGTVKLGFKQTVFTSDNRKYVFTSSQKIKNNDLTIILNPTSGERIIYQIMDYQLYIGNDIRNAQNPTLPALNCFERWKFLQYQPVQGKIHILNPSGIRPRTP